MEEKTKQKNKLTPAFILIFILLIFAFLISYIKNRNFTGVTYPVLDGHLVVNGIRSETQSDFGYVDGNNNFMINLTALDKSSSLDVIKSENDIIISNIKNQVAIRIGKNYVRINSTEFKDDDTYNEPIAENSEKVFADAKYIFTAFGYTMSYTLNAEETEYEVLLVKNEDFDSEKYSEIEAQDNDTKEEKKDSPSGWTPDEDESKRENNGEPITIPEQSEISQDDLSTPETIGNEENVDEESKEEKREARWNQIADEIRNLFQNSVPNYDKKAYVDLGSGNFGYNGASGGTYGNTVTVMHDVGDDHYNTVIYIGSEWSDQAKNVASDESRNFYLGLEDVYQKTLVYALGENEGNSFFEYLKEHADKTITGGYINKYDEQGVIQTEWTDGEVGDGIKASELDLSDWGCRYTDDGYEYEITRDEDGLQIIIF